MTPERILRRLRAELRLTGVAAWRGLVEMVNSNDLTHAASIAYYALLSFFPFLLLVLSVVGSISGNENDRLAILTFVFRYFPTKLDFVDTQLQAFTANRVQLGVAGALALISFGSLVMARPPHLPTPAEIPASTAAHSMGSAR